ncbi:MmcQ/YjbR family DNA-binding protein [Cryptosporangium sp. NPDC048952]|uniref:MmcQ/YjbR family DNA-binding protein n=1 Tax=Cryptosporangium sp. NPDC048952 TaxID=3363961 RepID=UPI00371CB8DA
MDVLESLRRICLALPEATERLSHGSPTWFVGNRRSFVTFADHVHGDEHVAFWCPAPPGVQEEMIATDPERFFRPPYVGPSGWLGVRLDVAVDWDEITEIVTEAYRVVAPKKLVARLDQP